ESFRYDLPWRFLVGPGQPARQLYFVAGIVKDAATGAVIAGATVQIHDGYSAGKSAVTNQYGYYRIDSILTGEPFTATASAPGYAAATKSYRVDGPIAYAGTPHNPPWLDFTLGK
ncbi:MAG: carboxypeptidase-like regulatory domain-containing protein, partial [Thermoanaerobaculia bacterium]